MDWFSPALLDFVDKVGAVTVVLLIALAIITDKLIWHTRYKAANDRADRWEKIALDALTGPAQAGVRAAEVAVDVVSNLPDPQGDRERAQSEGVGP